MFKKIAWILLLISPIITASIYACPSINVKNLSIEGHRWIRPSTGPNTAAYITIVNNSNQPDKLLKVECEEATSVELHDNIEENGITKMRPVESIILNEGKTSLKPGSLHIMLMGIKPSFQNKSTIPLTLHFENAGVVTIEFAVKTPDNLKKDISSSK